MTGFADMPCGNCACGIYAFGAVAAGIEMFRGVATRKEALAIAPICRHDAGHICFGTRDFILACEWPMDDARCASMLDEVSQ